MPDVSSAELEQLINSWVLNERDRAVIRRRLIDGIRFEPLAEEFDLSVSQVKRIVGKGKQTIFLHCR